MLHITVIASEKKKNTVQYRAGVKKGRENGAIWAQTGENGRKGNEGGGLMDGCDRWIKKKEIYSVE